MGQYFLIVNTEKEEYLHPHKFGNGLKLAEVIGGGESGALSGLALLLRQSQETGVGDWPDFPVLDEQPYLGRWAGDTITIVGDYDKSRLYHKARDHYMDISDPVRETLVEFLNAYRR